MILLNLGFLYLDFIDTYCGDFNAQVEKCIQCFVIVFQGSVAKNYVGETMYIIVYLKKIWKLELRYMSTSKYFINLDFNNQVGGRDKIVL